jgi:hypothetical protein
MLLEEIQEPLVTEPPVRGVASRGNGHAPSFWGRLLTALLRALAVPGA